MRWPPPVLPGPRPALHPQLPALKSPCCALREAPGVAMPKTISTWVICRAGVARQEIWSRRDAKREGYPGADLTRRLVIDARSAQAEIDGNIVLHLPDRPDQSRAGLKLADIALMEEFGDGPNDPFMRALDDGIDKQIGMPSLGERSCAIDVHRSPAPSLRDDAGKARAGSVLFINPGQQDAELLWDAGPLLLVKAVFAKAAFHKGAVTHLVR